MYLIETELPPHATLLSRPLNALAKKKYVIKMIIACLKEETKTEEF